MANISKIPDQKQYGVNNEIRIPGSIVYTETKSPI